jgi:DNA-binding response OmpR family regulator
VRGLLYALARHPARVLDKEALAEAAWGCPYDPRRHDNALKANVLHLRGLLAGSGLKIGCGNPGYCLDAFAPFVFVLPFDLLGGPWQIDHAAARTEPCTVVEHATVIDGVRHEIRIGARRISLRARPASRQLLYAFAAAPSQYLARDTIARVLWGIDYDPLRHESTLKSNIRRLRMLLAGFAELPSETGGYRIVLPDGVEFIPPVTKGQPSPGS